MSRRVFAFIILCLFAGLFCSQFIRIPQNIEELQLLANKLYFMYAENPSRTLVMYCAIYILLQTFAIPGSIMLSVIGGFLFGLPNGLALVCLCSSIGASFCFLLSKLLANSWVKGVRVDKWKSDIDKNRENLIFYLIFLRITPILPNWFINVSSPHLNIPLGHFFIATFLGVSIPSFIHVQAGVSLEKLRSTNQLSLFTTGNLSIIAAFAILSVLPILMRKKAKIK